MLVTSYIDWVVANPDWARFILHSRGRVEAGELGERLRADNQAHFARIHAALAGYRAEGLFREMPDDCFASVVIGPAHDLARQWLAGANPGGVGRLSRTAGAGGLGQRARGLRRPWPRERKSPAAAGLFRQGRVQPRRRNSGSGCSTEVW
ncbi:transcriptional regulator [Pseudomonas aeruginosa]|nr:transcriptional regulator [Pseudomonas aeruginosa]